MTSLFVDEKFYLKTNFYHGTDRYSESKSKLPTFTGVDSLVLYTLTPGAVSQFMDVKLCTNKCASFID